jgi:uncharacterized membrane protein
LLVDNPFKEKGALMFPPLPNWDGIHPLIIHFPVALLLTAPLLVLLGIIFPKVPGFLLSGMVLMILGTIGSYVAVSTGEAGAQLVMRTPEINTLLIEHEELAELVCSVFTLLVLLYSLLLVIPWFLKWQIRPLIRTSILLLFLAIYSAALLLLINTAHHGGLLVHVYGVQALVE